MEVKAVEAYQAGKTVEEIGVTLGKSKRSVISKLVQLKAYVAPEKPVKAVVEKGPTKVEILASLKDAGVPVEGLEVAKREALIRLRDFVAR